MSRRISDLEHALVRPAIGVFDNAELAGLPDPIARYFLGSIQLGTPLAQSTRITIRGRIKLKKWMRFAGTELLAPTAGFVWAVRAGPISGYDRYADGEGEMRWKLLGLIPLIHATGPDISRSAAARAAGEGSWLPTGLLPRFGVRWEPLDDTHIISRHTLNGHPFDCHHTLDDQARIVATRFERWGDPDASSTYALHPFGVEHSAYRTFSGMTIPAAGRAGWHYGTDRWPDGVFFEYEITALRPYP